MYLWLTDKQRQYGQGVNANINLPLGPGALVHLQGKAAENYLKDEFTKNKISVYEISKDKVDKEKVQGFFEGELKKNTFNSADDVGDVRYTADETGSQARRYSVYDGIALFGDNCVSVAGKGLKAGGSNLLSGKFLPLSVNKKLLSLTEDKKSGITNVTEDAKKGVGINAPVNTTISTVPTYQSTTIPATTNNEPVPK